MLDGGIWELATVFCLAYIISPIVKVDETILKIGSNFVMIHDERTSYMETIQETSNLQNSHIRI